MILCTWNAQSRHIYREGEHISGCLVLEVGVPREWLLMDPRLLFGVTRCSKIDCGDGCTTVWMYRTIELYTLKELHCMWIISQGLSQERKESYVESLKIVLGPNPPPLPLPTCWILDPFGAARTILKASLIGQSLPSLRPGSALSLGPLSPSVVGVLIPAVPQGYYAGGSGPPDSGSYSDMQIVQLSL